MATPNQEQIDYWNDKAGETWAQEYPKLDRMFTPLTDALIDAAAPKSGDRAVDIGCGCGETSLRLAERGGAVWGVDISQPMIEVARSRASGLANVAFSRADASTQTFTPDHQIVISRFGVMFFDDPVAAFANIRTALTKDGRLAFLCWQLPERNPWISQAAEAVQQYSDEPILPPDPTAAGPFAFGVADYTRSVLEDAGFSNVKLQPVELSLTLGENLDEALRFQSRIGPPARVLATLDDTNRAQALESLQEVLSAATDASGAVSMDAACWLVTANS